MLRTVIGLAVGVVIVAKMVVIAVLLIRSRRRPEPLTEEEFRAFTP